MNAIRQRLPDRRGAEHFNFICNGLHYTASIGRYADGELAEIFISNAKAGSHSDAAAKDAAVVCSIALQFGAPLDVIRHALLRDPRGVASSPLGAALDLIADEAAPCSAIASTAQLDTFADEPTPADDAELVVGLAIVMPTPCPRCRGVAATIGAGRGPHLASLMCTCGRHLGWMSADTFTFTTAIVRQFGRPTEPIVVRNRNQLPVLASTPAEIPPARPNWSTRMNRSELFPSKYLKAADLKGRPQTVIIEDVTREEVGDDKRSKPVMTFRGKTKGLVVNSTNYDTIADAYGDETSDWNGRPIELYPTKVDFKGTRTDAIRVRIPRTPHPAVKPAPEPVKPPPARDDMNDEIAF
jgi:hypothetical protein